MALYKTGVIEMDLEHLFKLDPYELEAAQKQDLMFNHLLELTKHHQASCNDYSNIINSIPNHSNSGHMIDELPFLPVRLFKMHELKSISSELIIKTLTSSGTTSQSVSKVYLDKETSILQTKALVNIVTSFIGNKRLPMILVDSPNVIKNRSSFSARGAGLMGLVNFGRDHFYLFDDEMNMDYFGLENFLERHQDEKILVFGFTFMVWKYFYQRSLENNKTINLNNGILIHSGGWKKLQEEAVDNETFKSKVANRFNLKQIYNFYGMVEQIGSIFMECEQGFLHAPNFADVIIRDPVTLRVLEVGATGLIQVLSILPKSYPGHNLLTEDLGTIYGEDNCSCGRKGKYFRVHGRLPSAELRGCSDTQAYDRR